jgi:methionine-R-sulfoxide reductase
MTPDGLLEPPRLAPKIIKSLKEWRSLLTPEQFRIARDQQTERPFCGAFFDNKKKGVYRCVCCGLPLYQSSAKFDSGTGWPSFFEPVCRENITTRQDSSHGMIRVELLCTRCDAHLGHLFDDGPPPTGWRHCINSESLSFQELP